jgi:tRNA pseudouridine32 synthase / 23S rRNA pseudouridine746 synthase
MSSNSFSKAPMPSYISLPDKGGFTSVYDFLIEQFPQIDAKVWHERITNQKVTFDDGSPVYIDTTFQKNRRLKYYREVVNEPKIPFEERVLFENEHFLIADKPHFLPIHPAGKYVNETLISRLRAKHNYSDLVAAHRLDRLTAGLVLCIKKKSSRAAYQNLFMERNISKSYLAVGDIPADSQTQWHVINKMAPIKENFRMQIIKGEANTESFIELIDSKDNLGLFKLKPVTGKKHQLRVHLCSIGSKIQNDNLYPLPSQTSEDCYDAPMQLLAQELSFIDPFTQKRMFFTSQLKLNF